MTQQELLSKAKLWLSTECDTDIPHEAEQAVSDAEVLILEFVKFIEATS